MTEENQKKLYKNFKRLSVKGVDEKQRTECGKYAAEILKSFPQFDQVGLKEVKEKTVEKSKSDKPKGEK